MQASSAHDIVPDGSSGNTIDAIAADDVKLSSAHDGSDAPRMQAQSVVEMNSFPVHKLRTVGGGAAVGRTRHMWRPVTPSSSPGGGLYFCYQKKSYCKEG